MTGRVERAIDVLLDAINNRTLAKGHCTACAVGNLVAHGLGGEVVQQIGNEFIDYTCKDIETGSFIQNNSWSDLFYTATSGYNGDPKQTYHSSYLNDRNVQRCINATEFSVNELMQIEYAFETNTKIKHESYNRLSDRKILEDQIKGLEAVVKVMLEFDNIKADVNEVFTNKVVLENE